MTPAGAPGVAFATPETAGAVLGMLRRAGGELTSTVQGDSMGAALPPGTRIRIRCGPAGDVAGQVVAFVIASRLVAHRVVRPPAGRPRCLVTRGDGRLLCDPPIPEPAVIGEVTARWDGGAWVPVEAAPTHTGARGAVTRVAEALVAGGLRVNRLLGHAMSSVLWAGPWLLRRARVGRVGHDRP